MMLVRLWHWAARVPVIPLLDGAPGAMRPPRFVEAVFGVY